VQNMHALQNNIATSLIINNSSIICLLPSIHIQIPSLDDENSLYIENLVINSVNTDFFSGTKLFKAKV
jgi:hypothetical protein